MIMTNRKLTRSFDSVKKFMEEVVIDVISGDGDIKYYRDENQVQHVPKKSLEDIIL